MTVDYQSEMRRLGIIPSLPDAMERLFVELGREAKITLVARKKRGRPPTSMLAYRVLDRHIGRFMHRERLRAEREGRTVKDVDLRVKALRDPAVRAALKRVGLKIAGAESARVQAIKGRKARQHELRRRTAFRDSMILAQRWHLVRMMGADPTKDYQIRRLMINQTVI